MVLTSLSQHVLCFELLRDTENDRVRWLQLLQAQLGPAQRAFAEQTQQNTEDFSTELGSEDTEVMESIHPARYIHPGTYAGRMSTGIQKCQPVFTGFLLFGKPADRPVTWYVSCMYCSSFINFCCCCCCCLFRCVLLVLIRCLFPSMIATNTLFQYSLWLICGFYLNRERQFIVLALKTIYRFESPSHSQPLQSLEFGLFDLSQLLPFAQFLFLKT